MNFNFKVVATSFASISLVISASGFFTGHTGMGWGFAMIGVAAFVLSFLGNRGDR